MIAMARAIDYALGDDDSISQGSDESEVSEDMNYIADSYGGTLNLLAAYFSTTIAGNIAGAMSAGAEGSLVREFFGWNTYLEGRFIQVMNVIGPVISVYSVSESFNTGNCVPETAYTNSDHCRECGGLEGQFICSENRCGILGADKDYCEWESKEDGGNDGVCLPSDPLDTSVPSINYMGFKMLNADGIFIDEMETSGHTMETQEFGWYDANTVRLNITLDEESKCRGSFEDEKDFEDMGEYKFEGRYTFDHTLEFNLTGQQKMHGENTFYIKCTDVNGNVNRQNDDINWIKILFGEEPNEVPPEIVDIDPDNRIMLPEGTNQIDLRIIVEDRVDEVTECKYGYNISNYEDLPNSFNRDGSTSCPGSSLPNDCYQFSNDFEFNEEDSVIFELEGYDGNATVYPYIFGCIDDYGNSKLINYSFTVYPGFDMNITSPEEGDRIYDSTPDLNISLGIIANCEYKIDNSPEWIEFGPSVNAELEDPLSGSVAGNSHTIAVKCRDLAYNEVEKSVNFVVLSDESGPSMTRLYTRGLFGSGGNLYIALNEESECAFNDEESFDFEDGTLMLPVHPRRRIGNGDNQKILSNEHASNWNSLKYYIKCRDEWENEASFVVYP
jgi:hypothetical protein